MQYLSFDEYVCVSFDQVALHSTAKLERLKNEGAVPKGILCKITQLKRYPLQVFIIIIKQPPASSLQLSAFNGPSVRSLNLGKVRGGGEAKPGE
jgi:hypothetical protein